jgi:hypothetical protein
VLVDKKIHAARIVIKPRAVGSAKVGVNASCGHAELKHALHLVMLYQRRAKNLSQLSIGVAARGIHLPQAVLRSHVALRDEKIVLAGGLKMRHAMCIAADCHRRCEAS